MAGVGNEAAGTLTVRWVVGIETGGVDTQTANIETIGRRPGTCNSINMVDPGVGTAELVQEG